MRESREYERQKRERARRFDEEDAREYRRRHSRNRSQELSSRNGGRSGGRSTRGGRRPTGNGYRSQGNGNGAGKLPLIIAGLVVAVIAIILIGNVVMEEFGRSREKQDLAAYFGLSSPDEAVLLINGVRSEEKAMLQNGTVFLPMSVANSFYDNFYYDSTEGHLLVTGATRTTEGVQGSDYIPGETVYISLVFLNRFCPMEYEIFENPYRIVINTIQGTKEQITVADDTELRVSADKKSPILIELKKGDIVDVAEAGEAWTKIRYQAVEGYAENKFLGDQKNTVNTALSGGAEADANYQRVLRSHKIVLGFHNVAVSDANNYFNEATSKTKGMNVIAPTWFSIIDNDGHMSDLGNKQYMSMAHEKGYEVWGVFDNFGPDSDSNQVLSRTSTRVVLEQEIMSKATEYGLDGINIDFEQLKGETGDDFAQFLRELSILTRAAGIVLSVDNYVPQDYTDFYRRDIQGRVADYVVIMGYDEHTSASSEAGSVASLGFVTQGIEDTLKEVPADQVINAVPFYTRKWAYENGVLSCESMGMADAKAFLADNGVQAVWDAETCQNYASFEKNGVQYSIWLEDAQSIESKLQVMVSHNLGGVACWKLTQETADIWDVINAYYPPGQ
ncbi:MAG: hypothetical protein K6G03_02830 [Lachnospiraceae bacterium]|nr:hypothetical protein [Lachnospiraceae bacterium]